MNHKLAFSKILWIVIFPIFTSGCVNTKNILSTTQTTQSDETIYCGYYNEPANAIYFDFNSSKLNQAGVDQLNKIIKEIRLVNYKEIRVYGNTDKIGTYNYNLLLGKNRANSVKSYLIANGFDADKLQVISLGEKFASENIKLSAKYRRVILLLVTN